MDFYNKFYIKSTLVIQLILIVLKITGVANIDWFFILIPFWLILMTILSFIVIYAMLIVLAKRRAKGEDYKRDIDVES